MIKTNLERTMLFLEKTGGERGEMDFSVYSLPRFVGDKIGKKDLWLPSDVGLLGAEKRTPFFIFGNDKINAYNWLDAGNWM